MNFILIKIYINMYGDYIVKVNFIKNVIKNII